MRAEVEPARAQAAADAQAEEAQLAVLNAKKVQVDKDLQAVSDAIAAELRASSAAPPASGTAGGCEARPAAGPIVSGFGSRTNPIGGGSGFHSGVDIAAPMGAPIYACWSGRVAIAGWQGGYGNAIVLDHGGGKGTLYGHQSRFAVSVGQTVSAGQVIGFVGSTGNSTGPHLHFEVRINGIPVNPMPYL
jgi:murein DD-endopeptidase MepM/ murein hydrolase activator NlpD